MWHIVIWKFLQHIICLPGHNTFTCLPRPSPCVLGLDTHDSVQHVFSCVALISESKEKLLLYKHQWNTRKSSHVKISISKRFLTSLICSNAEWAKVNRNIHSKLLRNSLGNLQQSPEIFGKVQKCSETFVRPSDNILKVFRKLLEIFRKSSKTS